MNEILYHLRNPGMIDPLVNTEQKMVSHGFKAVQDFVHPQYFTGFGFLVPFPRETPAIFPRDPGAQARPRGGAGGGRAGGRGRRRGFGCQDLFGLKGT